MTDKPPCKARSNGPPPENAVSIYSGTVMHHRMKPKKHRFDYTVFSMLLDLDRLEEARKSSWLFSVNRFNLLSFHERDHGPRDGSSLRRHVESLLEQESLEAPARILLLAYPRMLGYVFNPLSVYYAYDSSDRLTAIIYEVRNTFGGIHTYTAPVKPEQVSASGIRQDQRKEFYVSPFISMEQHYFFRMLPPGKRVSINILEKDPEGPLLSATFSGQKKPMSSRHAFRECLRVPLMTFKVMAAIHWEAFKIWRKRVPFHSNPDTNNRRRGLDRKHGRAPLTSNR